MSVNTLTTLSEEAKTFYDKTLLQRLVPNLVFAKFGQKKSIKSTYTKGSKLCHPKTSFKA